MQASIDTSFDLFQKDGSPPEYLITAVSPGAHGVAILESRFAGSAHLRGAVRDHLVTFILSGPAQLHCRIDDSRMDHMASTGSLSICPDGTDCSVDTGVG